MKEIAKLPNNGSVTIDHFPPRSKLRKIAEFMLYSDRVMSIKTACDACNVNYDSARTMIARYRKNGIDFNDLLNKDVLKRLGRTKDEVYNSLNERAISGSYNHQKLFAQLTGDLVERTESTQNIQAKIMVFSPTTIPKDIQELRAKERDKDGVQIIDLEFDK